MSPNICIETAVERVTVAQMQPSVSPKPDVIVTVTNDGWFDDSSLIDHHLALRAIGRCRNPASDLVGRQQRSRQLGLMTTAKLSIVCRKASMAK